MKLEKISTSASGSEQQCPPANGGWMMNRREFLRNSSLTAAGGAILGTGLTAGMMQKAEAATDEKGAVKTVKTILCAYPHYAVLVLKHRFYCTMRQTIFGREMLNVSNVGSILSKRGSIYY